MHYNKKFLQRDGLAKGWQEASDHLPAKGQERRARWEKIPPTNSTLFFQTYHFNTACISLSIS